MNPHKIELEKTLNAARQLAAKASAAGREFTDEELAVATELQRRAMDLEVKAQQYESDQKVKAAIADLGLGIGVDPGLVPSVNGGQVKADDPAAVKTATKTATGTSRVPARVKATGGTCGWGEAVTKRLANVDGLKSLLSGNAVPVSVPLNPEPVRIGEPVISMLQLIPAVRDDVGRWSYLRQTARTNTATVVAPGEKKPTSTYTLVRVDERSRVIAHLSEPVSKQDLDDAPALMDFVDTELRLGLDLALEAQIVNGSGSGENFVGIGNVSGAQAQAYSNDLFETTRKAITRLEVINLSPTGWLFNPSDWETLELLANNEGDFMLGGGAKSLPVDRAARRLWGVPVATSTAVTAGVAYLADFAGSTKLHVRQEATLDATEAMYDPDRFGADDGGTLFEANQIQFRAEMRAGLEISRPSGIVEVDLTTA